MELGVNLSQKAVNLLSTGMNPDTLVFIIGMSGSIILLLLAVIGVLIKVLYSNQQIKNNELSNALINLNNTMSAMNLTLAKIPLECENRHQPIDAFLEELSKKSRLATKKRTENH